MQRDEQGSIHPSSDHELEPDPTSDPASGPTEPTPDPEPPEAGDEAQPEGRAADEHAPAGANGSAGDSASAEATPAEQIEGHHLLRPWSDREEVRALPEILRPAEAVVAVGSGAVVRTGRLARSKWLVVLTDRRLLCIKGREAATRKVIDMPVAQIREVESSGLVRKTLSLDTGYGTLRIGGLTKPEAAELVSGITRGMGVYAGDEPVAPEPRPAPADAGPDPSDGDAPGHAPEAVRDLEKTVARLEETVEELTDRVAFVEELVRSNVADPSEDMEVPT